MNWIPGFKEKEYAINGWCKTCDAPCYTLIIDPFTKEPCKKGRFVTLCKTCNYSPSAVTVQLSKADVEYALELAKIASNTPKSTANEETS